MCNWYLKTCPVFALVLLSHQQTERTAGGWGFSTWDVFFLEIYFCLCVTSAINQKRVLPLIYFYFSQQGFAIYCPSGQFAKLHQIKWRTCQTTDRRQVQGEQLEAFHSHLSWKKTETVGSFVFCASPRMRGCKISFGSCSLCQNPFFAPSSVCHFASSWIISPENTHTLCTHTVACAQPFHFELIQLLGAQLGIDIGSCSSHTVNVAGIELFRNTSALYCLHLSSSVLYPVVFLSQRLHKSLR